MFSDLFYYNRHGSLGLLFITLDYHYCASTTGLLVFASELFCIIAAFLHYGWHHGHGGIKHSSAIRYEYNQNLIQIIHLVLFLCSLGLVTVVVFGRVLSDACCFGSYVSVLSCSGGLHVGT